MTRVVVHIDKLVLRGVDRSDATVLSDTIQSELGRLLGTPSGMAALVSQGDRQRVQLGKVTPVTGPNAVGCAIASRIAGGKQ